MDVHATAFPLQDPELYINSNKIPVVEEKFLELYFDLKLTFLSHIEYVKKKCLKALDILCVVAHLDWGADRALLLQLYQALVRSKLDYGCIVYGSTRSSSLKILDPIMKLLLSDYQISRLFLQPKCILC